MLSMLLNKNKHHSFFFFLGGEGGGHNLNSSIYLAWWENDVSVLGVRFWFVCLLLV